ncbi:MAG: hypothetical protein HRT90_06610 [Candidatus Margulisbacteria bacterium]|nr:hypothetical protein [Candidatus Margulisiibacteriota bacterium]
MLPPPPASPHPIPSPPEVSRRDLADDEKAAAPSEEKTNELNPNLDKIPDDISHTIAEYCDFQTRKTLKDMPKSPFKSAINNTVTKRANGFKRKFPMKNSQEIDRDEFIASLKKVPSAEEFFEKIKDYKASFIEENVKGIANALTDMTKDNIIGLCHLLLNSRQDHLKDLAQEIRNNHLNQTELFKHAKELLRTDSKDARDFVKRFLSPSLLITLILDVYDTNPKLAREMMDDFDPNDTGIRRAVLRAHSFPGTYSKVAINELLTRINIGVA